MNRTSINIYSNIKDVCHFDGSSPVELRCSAFLNSEEMPPERPVIINDKNCQSRYEDQDDTIHTSRTSAHFRGARNGMSRTIVRIFVELSFSTSNA